MEKTITLILAIVVACLTSMSTADAAYYRRYGLFGPYYQYYPSRARHRRVHRVEKRVVIEKRVVVEKRRDNNGQPQPQQRQQPQRQQESCPLSLLPFVDPCKRRQPAQQCEIRHPDGTVSSEPCITPRN